MNIEMKGFFKTIRTYTDGTEQIDTFENMVVDNGLDIIRSDSTFIDECYVGTSTTPVTTTDTAMGTLLATSTGKTIVNSGVGGRSGAYYIFVTNSYDFGAIDDSLITEVGTGSPTNGLFSRALLKDDNNYRAGLKTADVANIRIEYELRMYINHATQTGIVNIGGTDYTWEIAPSRVKQTEGMTWDILRAMLHFDDLTVEAKNNGAVITDVRENMTGTVISTGATCSSQVVGSNRVELTVSLDGTQGNDVNGLGGLQFEFGKGVYQSTFNPAIPKDNTQSFSITFFVEFNRKIYDRGDAQ